MIMLLSLSFCSWGCPSRNGGLFVECCRGDSNISRELVEIASEVPSESMMGKYEALMG